jgi:hypothetical protein
MIECRTEGLRGPIVGQAQDMTTADAGQAAGTGAKPEAPGPHAPTVNASW